MTLNHLAWEMWERLGYREIDPSVLSRVVNGERLFTAKQLEIFCKVLFISTKEYESLLDSLLLEIAEKAGISLKLIDDNIISDIDEDHTQNEDSIMKEIENSYYYNLINSDRTGKLSIDYWHNQFRRFSEGEFDKVYQEINSFESFIRNKNFQKERRGKRWLVIVSALRGLMLTHKMSPKSLRENFDLPFQEIRKYEYFTNDFIEASPLLYLGWAGLMRLCGEALSEAQGPSDTVLNLFVRSYELRKKAANMLLKEDTLHYQLSADNMSVVMEVKRLFPQKASLIFRKNEDKELYEEGLNYSEVFGRKIISLFGLFHEFKAKYNLKSLMLSKIKQQVNERKSKLIEAEMEVKKTEVSLKNAEGNAKLIGINSAVTKVSLYKAAGQSVPKKVLENALNLVVRSKDVEQASRLLNFI